MAIATFGGGCFWCTEAVFLELVGVGKVTSGYMGGSVESPTYEAVCTGTTGHAEVIQIEFEPNSIAYESLLDVFFQTHDPTTLNRQGADTGTQYRSVVFYHDESQQDSAEKFIEKLDASGAFQDNIVTEVAPAEIFYPAEAYHQNFFERNPSQPYCMMVVKPKVDKFKAKFSEQLK